MKLSIRRGAEHGHVLVVTDKDGTTRSFDLDYPNRTEKWAKRNMIRDLFKRSR